MSRPRFAPNDAQKMQVEIAAACGLPHAHICQRILNPDTGKPIDEKTLRQAFRAQLDSGMATANAAVAQNLFKQATGSGAQAVNAAKFWLSCRAGWKATEELSVTHNGAIGQVAVDRWVDAELRERIAREMLHKAGYAFDD